MSSRLPLDAAPSSGCVRPLGGQLVVKPTSFRREMVEGIGRLVSMSAQGRLASAKSCGIRAVRELMLVKICFLLIAMALAVGSPVGASPAADPLMAPVHQFINGFNAGDVKRAMATFAPSVAIVDDVAPFQWSGPKAMATWVNDLTASESKAGITDGKVTVGAPLREVTDGARAYVVVPTVYHFKEHGRPMHDTARMALVLRKIGGSWLIVAWTWAGATPRPGK